MPDEIVRLMGGKNKENWLKEAGDPIEKAFTWDLEGGV